MRTQGTYYIRGTEGRKDGRTDGRTEGRNAENYVPPLFFEKAGDNKQGDTDSEVIICFGTKCTISVDPIQLLKVITVLGFTLRHFHNLFVE